MSTTLGDKSFDVVTQMYIADFVPRVPAGLEALGDLSDVAFNAFLPVVVRVRGLDALAAEVVRL